MITLQYEHKLVASVQAWVEHTLLSKGNAYTNSSGFFYPIVTNSNYFTYSLPYRPLVSNASITGASIMSGVYLDRTYITAGQSGLMGVNFEKGLVYFTGQITGSTSRLSGNYAVSDFNVKPTSEPEESLLFENKYFLKSKVNQTVSGLGVNDITFPVVYVKNFSSDSNEFAFGGHDKYTNRFRLIVLGDSQYTADGVASIFRDKARTMIPMITGHNEMPFNNYGDFANGIYNYNVLLTGRNHSNDSIWLESVTSINGLPGTSYAELRKINPFVFVSLIDLELQSYRIGRS